MDGSAAEQILLRVYLQNGDRAPHEPTFQRLLGEARRRGLAGTTVLRGILGYGRRGWARPDPWSLVQHEPMVVEMVDRSERIVSFLSEVGSMELARAGGMATLERAAVLMYRHQAQTEPLEMALAEALHPLSTVPSIAAEDPMTITESGVLLRIFIGESDRLEGRPLYEAVVQKARELGLAGATVLRGTEGFGAHSVVHSTSVLLMSTDLPVVIEIVDEQDKIDQLLPHIESMVKEGMVTMEYVKVLLYRHQKS